MNYDGQPILEKWVVTEGMNRPSMASTPPFMEESEIEGMVVFYN
jgi:hypothetical protein